MGFWKFKSLGSHPLDVGNESKHCRKYQRSNLEVRVKKVYVYISKQAHRLVSLSSLEMSLLFLLFNI